ncbi:iron transporter [Methylobacterium sp. J-070]|uniref:iron transporter n=1 Tax=Methylobacterium sp. J-070 TaxID=2836650 RepID=UPI001FBA0F2C|nr:iron transporter [Methylobacterium sp. J-070]MCJ2051544.1 iron transporter [Methylobacterium sp. J-070]
MSARTISAPVYRRLIVAGRVGLAALGGYAVAALASGVLALILPGPRAEAVSTAMLASFAIMATAVIWVFAARTLRRAALILGVAACALTAALWLAGAFRAGGAA